MPSRITPSLEQLQAAWQARRRSDWPTTLEATLAQPLLAALVRAEAVHRELVARRMAKGKPASTSRSTSTPASLPPRMARSPSQPTASRRLPFDGKRAASGDRDDD